VVRKTGTVGLCVATILVLAGMAVTLAVPDEQWAFGMTLHTAAGWAVVIGFVAMLASLAVWIIGRRRAALGGGTPRVDRTAV
jgi:hypothetical protein